MSGEGQGLSHGRQRRRSAASILLCVLSVLLAAACRGPEAASVFSFNDSKTILMNLRVDLVLNGSDAKALDGLSLPGPFIVTASMLAGNASEAVSVHRLGESGSTLTLTSAELGSLIAVEGQLPAATADSALLNFTLSSGLGLDSNVGTSLQALAVAHPNVPAAANVAVHISLASTAAAQILTQVGVPLVAADSLNTQLSTLVSSIETLQVSTQTKVKSSASLTPATYMAAMLAALVQQVQSTDTLVTQVQSVVDSVAPTNAAIIAAAIATLSTSTASKAPRVSDVFSGFGTTATVSSSPSAATSPVSTPSVSTPNASSNAPSSKAPALAYTNAAGTLGEVGTAMSIAPTVLTKNGVALAACALASGSPALPAGLSLSPTTCVISGTPTAASGAITLSVIASNAAGPSAAALVSLTILTPAVSGSAAASGTSSPTAGSGITFSNQTTTSLGSESITMAWGAGTDAQTPPASLEYRVVRALQSSSINTAALVSACGSGCTVLQDWTAGLTSLVVSNLASNSQHYVAVAVRNAAGGLALYEPNSFTTSWWTASLGAGPNYDYVMAAVNPSGGGLGVYKSAWNSGTQAYQALAQVGANPISSAPGGSFTVAVDATNTIWFMGLKSYGSWSGQAQVLSYGAGTWTQLGSDIAAVTNCYGSMWYSCEPSGVMFLGGTTPYVYFTGSTGAVYQTDLATWNGSSWSNHNNSTLGSTSGGAVLGGVPYVYGDNGVAAYSGGVWSVLGSLGINGQTEPASNSPTRLGIDASNNLYFAFRDNANGSRLSVKEWNGSSWSNLGSAGFSAGQVDGVSLIMVGNTPYVVYREASLLGDVVVQKWSGSAWSVVAAAVFGGEVMAPVVAYDGSSLQLAAVPMAGGSSAKRVAISP